MSEQTKEIKVTLETLVLTPKDIEQVYALAEGMIHKDAKVIVGFFEAKIKEQLEAKVAKLQAEYAEKAAALKAVPAQDEVAEVV